MNSSNTPAEPTEKHLYYLSQQNQPKPPNSFLAGSSTALLPMCTFGGAGSANGNPSANNYYPVYFH